MTIDNIQIPSPTSTMTKQDAARRRRGVRLRLVRRIPTHVILTLVCLIWAAPTLGLIVTSFRTPGDVATTGWWDSFVRPAFTAVNYQSANDLIDIGNAALNSLAITIPTTIGTVTLSAAAAFILACTRFRGRLAILFVIVGLLAVPPQVTLVPLLRLFGSVGLTGNAIGVSLYQIGFTLPFGIFLVYGFLDSFPKEILESARIDGASEVTVFTRIVVPGSAPVLAALAMMQFLWSWNDLLTPLLFDSGSNTKAPFTVQIAGLVQSNGNGQEIVAAASLASVVLPVLILLGLQRYFIRGITAGAVKG